MEIGAQTIHQAYIIHRDACHINYLLEPKLSQTQNNGYHLNVQHFLWNLDMQQYPYGTNGNDDRGLVYTWGKVIINHVMLRWYSTLYHD